MSGRTFLVFSSIILMAAGSLAQKEQPSITCGKPAYDFGKKPNTASLSHTFLLTNVGQAPLEIKKVRTGCGCVTRRLEKKTLAPGESTGLEIALNLKNRSGKQRRTIYVHTNDPMNKIFRLRITGNVLWTKKASSPPGPVKVKLPRRKQKAVQLQPETLDFGQVHEDADVSTCIDISGGNEEFRILDISTTGLQSFRVWVEKAGSKNEKPSIKIKTLPPLAPGVKKGKIVVTTSDSRSPSFTIPVSIMVMNDLYAIPERITVVHRPAERATVTRYLRIRSRSGQSFTISRVRPPKRSMSVEITSDFKRRGYLLTVKGIRSVKELDGRMLRIRLNLSGVNRDMEIPFSVKDRIHY